MQTERGARGAKAAEWLRNSIAVKEKFLASGGADRVEEAARMIASALRKGGRVYFFGNGGSAADAQHLAGELVGRFTMERAALPAVALTTDTSVLTSISNDYTFDRCFERQVEALVRRGDVVFAISTSGNSPNVLRGAKLARRRGARVIGLTGETGGKLKALAHLCLCAPAATSGPIQECHIAIGHALCALVEEALFGGRRGH
jgi:D-sedoheptulose 7-phosphate isomerase